MNTRRPISFLSATLCGLALGAAVLLAGCGGGGGNGNSGGSPNTGTNSGGTGGASLAAGSYQGVYLNTSGQYSPDAGTIAFTVSPTGAVSGADIDYTGDGSTNNLTGTVSSTGALVTNAVSGTVSQNSTTHVFTTSYTESNGTKGMLSVGLAPTASPLAGSYSGTVMNSKQQLPMTLSISSVGIVTGTVGTPSVANQGFNLTGYVDTSGNVYLAYNSGGVPADSVGNLSLNGTALSGTFQETGSDGSGGAFTASLTKQ